MTQKERTVFFELLKSALWEKEPDWTVLDGEWDWSHLLKAFENHSLLGVVANAIMSLPAELQPNPMQQVEILQYVANLMQTHESLDSAIAKSFTDLKEAGCHPVLLKGQGLATLYPDTCVRNCGDIDVYVGTEEMDRAVALAQSKATPEEIAQAEDNTTEHHYHIKIQGIIYEIHRYAGIAGNMDYRKKYQEISDAYLKPDRVERVEIPCAAGNGAGLDVEVPPMAFNVWYVFNHLVQHFREGGVGLRQFCDWLMILRAANVLGIDYSALERDLDAVGLKRVWCILGGILVNQLGLSAESFPLYVTKMAKRSQGFILEKLADGKSFGFESMDDSFHNLPHGWRRMSAALNYFYHASLPLFVISPTYPIKSFVRFLSLGLKGLKKRLH